MFKPALTFGDPAGGSNPQRGFPAPGAGAQTTGPGQPRRKLFAWAPERPTKGTRTYVDATAPTGLQQGFPSPLDAPQARPAGSMPNVPPVSGMPVEVWTPYYDRGAAAYVQNFGKVLYNPIGAGIVANYRTQSSYGGAAMYENGAFFWTSQVTPTSIPGQPLSWPQDMADQLGPLNVQAVLRVG